MWRYIFKRLLLFIPMILAISLLTFLLLRLTPGNFLDTIRMDPQISEETIAYYEKQYQLDKHWMVQYGHWLKNLLKLEFGYSFHYNVPVVKVIGSRLFNTFLLSFASFLLTWMIAVPVGIWAAVHRNQLIDRVIQLCAYLFLSMPSFFLAMLLLYWASQTGFLPLGGMYSPDFDQMSWPMKVLDVLKHLAIPAVALSVRSIASLQKIMRGNMLEELGKQYVLSARAKGLPENSVVYRHALRNAFNPMITLLGYEFSALLSGAALVEIITSWPGLGSLMLTAARAKDIYLVMTTLLMGSFLFLLGNLIADLALAKLDPRIRYER